MSARTALCSSCVPWEKLRRKTSAPASMSCRSTSGVRDAGPMVTTIFVRLVVDMGRECRRLRHGARLPRRSEHAAPEGPLRVDLLPLGHGERDRDVGKLMIPEAHDHIGPPAHPGVNGIVPQEQAERGVMGGGWNASDGVARIDVFERDRHLPFAKVRLYRVAQKHSDVSVL